MNENSHQSAKPLVDHYAPTFTALKEHDEKPQPEKWEVLDKLIDENTALKLDLQVYKDLLLAQKEQMLEVLAWMQDDIKFVRKMVPGGQHTLDSCQGCSQTWSSCVCVERNIGYNSALEDVEEKLKAL